MTDREASPPAGAAPVSSLLLAVPAFALAFAITTVSALVPLTLERQAASTLLIGMVVAGEGLIALLLPLWIGPLSDRTRSAWGGRLPYVALGSVLCASALLGLPFVASIAGIALAMLVFYAGYFTYYPAYRALYPELVPEARFARSQGVQSLLREVGLVLALTASPMLFALEAWLPFFVCALALLAISALFVLRLRSRVPHVPAGAPPSARPRLPPASVRRVLLANALFEFALSGLKSFVVLFVVVGTGRTTAAASGLMAIVAVVAVVAAPLAGWLGDRFGPLRVTRAALVVYALGLFLPCITRSLWVLIPAMPLVGFGGTVVMTLSYTLVALAGPEQSPGASAGWYELSRGVGVIAGPIVTGAAIDVLRPLFESTQGYAAMWLVQALALLASLPLVPKQPARETAR
ncbi:MAG TPA: MFS transporter [Polyangiaceae bacterium]|nr:MFS transporter [Polyangiaceae bacterium]